MKALEFGRETFLPVRLQSLFAIRLRGLVAVRSRNLFAVDNFCKLLRVMNWLPLGCAIML